MANRSRKPLVQDVNEDAFRTIASIFEAQMDEMGLTETQKNAKVAEITAFVDRKINDRAEATAKPLEPHRIATSRA